MNVAYVTVSEAKDVAAWSGIPFHMAKALPDGETELELVGPLRVPFRIRGRLKRGLYRTLGKTYHPYRSTRVARHYARQVAQALSRGSASVVLSPGAVPIAFLETNLPIVFWADATFASLVGYYPDLDRLPRESLEDGYSMEKAVFERAAAAIFASEWAAEGALRTTGWTRLAFT